MFKDYESKPTRRKAMKITEDMTLKDEGDPGENIMRCGYDDQDRTRSRIDFKYHQDVKVGDYIVYLTENDIYHCSAEVFAERNIID